jgi:LmbE family N-acetylglucosaminyl deacetylase
MYVAAHPDDENTRLISWLSNHMHVNTVYLSLTRGDGGQNLIGTEKGPLLGLLRTQELLQARKIDGGKQFFTRANDFGYSKTATETRSIWEEDEIMSDVVWAIRKFQPDILINRFDHNSNGRTHGHHTFSAIASLEAFDLSGDQLAFPDQLSEIKTWQPKRVFFNTSWWFYGSQENFEKADKSKMVSVDIGTYYPIRGISNNEIAAQSRSMHKCQGFGSAATRGSQMEYLEFLKGDPPTMENGGMTNIFEGIDMTWSRVSGGAKIDEKIGAILTSFDFSDPSASVPALIELRDVIQRINSPKHTVLIKRKLNELRQIIHWCTALYIEFTTNSEMASPGDSIDIQIELINRGTNNIILNNILLLPANLTLDEKVELAFNDSKTIERRILIPEGVSYSSPYWLEESMANVGMYVVRDQKLRGQPESDPIISASFNVSINEVEFQLAEILNYKYTDPAIGEIYSPVTIAPPVSVTLPEPVYLLANGQPADIVVEVRSHSDNVMGEVMLEVDDLWTVTPKSHTFSIDQTGDKRNFTFKVMPPEQERVATIRAKAMIDGDLYERSYAKVDYDHISKQSAFLPSEAIIEHLKITIPNMRIGYIAGAGDVIPESLRQLGIIVDEIHIESTSLEQLKQYHSVVIGIRAFNTQSALTYFADDLWKYVESGGTVITQYSTFRGLKAEPAPLPLNLSRDRITEENATLNILQPQHPIFNIPNKISESDFDNWVQERGLYFADEWDESFTPLLSGHDVGEDEKQGMLLVAPYGKGQYIYTGLSFFRQLPAGVPGAYRLFINMLALHNNKP